VGFNGSTQWDGNLQTAVQPDKLYRSAQLTPAGFAQAIKPNGIKSTLKLRGADRLPSCFLLVGRG